ncbi:hypothetical protein DdX_03568 [Ditylenchus destructor]|uniref:Uncharacterized protein n=1 Tax=Ditylenchus destructor TaxID=166010 RepID=A0AAD4NCB6_9BILA|nr:hypothetical protein DdX_03568 [Ditylenchus destructor]
MIVQLMQTVLYFMLFVFTVTALLYIYSERQRVTENLDIVKANCLSDDGVFPSQKPLPNALPPAIFESRSKSVCANSHTPSYGFVRESQLRIYMPVVESKLEHVYQIHSVQPVKRQLEVCICRCVFADFDKIIWNTPCDCIGKGKLQ